MRHNQWRYADYDGDGATVAARKLAPFFKSNL